MEVAADPQLPQAVEATHVAFSRHYDDRWITQPALFSQGLEEALAIHDWHVEVQQDQLGGLLLETLEGLLTMACLTDVRVVHANLDHYISYAVTFENRGPYATLGNRTYQLISFDANWNQTVHSGGCIKTGMAPGEKSESSPIQTNINAKLIWFVVLDGKDNNGWNDLMLLYDNR